MPRSRHKKLPWVIIATAAGAVVLSLSALWCVARAEDWWFRPENVTVPSEPRTVDPALLELGRRTVVALERWQR